MVNLLKDFDSIITEKFLKKLSSQIKTDYWHILWSSLGRSLLDQHWIRFRATIRVPQIRD